ncbi:MAG: hypothetical protein A2Y25_08575 [Candidatus Melainabacteria bacterium GWF2_37_15]|nr:MAG: hypothetical protein A2Y25_08575 [Candidatus Melainabacteria bacterium GWF2_37_15]
MLAVINPTYSSIWLKPIFKCLDKIIDCNKSEPIQYNEIQTGNIINLEFKDSENNAYERTYIATSNWGKDVHSGSFINMHGRQVVLSDKVLMNLNVSMIGSFES